MDNASTQLLRLAAPAAPAVMPAQPVLGIPLALTTYEHTLDWIDQAVQARSRSYICVAAVHTVMASQEDPELRDAVLGADFTVPDGQPLVWAMNLLGHNLSSRVYGPDLMAHACERAARTGQRFYLYGGRSQGALVELARMLRLRYPGLKIVGGHAPPFRTLTAEEDTAIIADIERCRPDVIWVGIGVPRQEKWMARIRDRLSAPVLIGVGAAFDFHAGIVAQAPTRCSGSGSNGRSGSARSRAACGGATCATTRASSWASPGSTGRTCAAGAASRSGAMTYDVSVIGLGRVGLPLALCFADAGLRVLGVDPWNALGAGRVFASASEVAALRA